MLSRICIFVRYIIKNKINIVTIAAVKESIIITIVFAKENTTEAILDAIRKGYSVAGELPIKVDDDVTDDNREPFPRSNYIPRSPRPRWA